MSDQKTSSEIEAPRKKDKQRPRDPATWARRAMSAYRREKNQLDFRPGPDFFELADPLIETKKTLLGYDRLYVFWQVVRNVTKVPGNVAEVGAFRGGSAFFIATTFRMALGADVTMHVIDTFEGHPEPAISEHDVFQAPGQFSRTSYDEVRQLLAPFPQLTVHKSDVIPLLPQLEDARYRLVHIDTDLYQPTIDCLEYFGARMSPGGVIVVDDYSSKKCPGVPKATSEYLERTDLFQVWDLRSEQLVLVKRAQ